MQNNGFATNGLAKQVRQYFCILQFWNSWQDFLHYDIAIKKLHYSLSGWASPRRVGSSSKRVTPGRPQLLTRDSSFWEKSIYCSLLPIITERKQIYILYRYLAFYFHSLSTTVIGFIHSKNLNFATNVQQMCINSEDLSPKMQKVDWIWLAPKGKQLNYRESNIGIENEFNLWVFSKILCLEWSFYLEARFIMVTIFWQNTTLVMSDFKGQVAAI